MRFSVVIPIYNARACLEASIDSVLVAAAAHGSVEALLLDNGSNDGSWPLLVERYGAHPLVARLEQTGGTVAAVRNHGTRLAQGEIFSFVDSDCVVPRNYFSAAEAVFAATGAEAVGSSYELPEQPSWIEETWDELHRPTKECFVAWLNAGNLLVRRAAFEAAGGFDETLVTAEDVDLGDRLRAVGARIYESPRIVAVHLGNPKSLAHFYRKHRWHGVSALARRGDWWRQKPLVLTLGHVAGLLAATLLLLVPSHFGLAERLAGTVALGLAAPTAAVLFRMIAGRRLGRPLRSVFLYFVYFAARIDALGIALRKRARSGGRVEGQAYYP